MSQFHLEDLDVDGAIREHAEAVPHHTRQSFLRKAGIAGGAALSSGAILGMVPSLAEAAPSKKQDLAILNFALTLEYLEASFYKEAVEGGALSGDALELTKLVSNDENTHVSAIRRTIKNLGGKPVTKPSFDFKGTTKDQALFLATSFTLENTGVRAYLGQAPRLKSKALLATAGSIVTVEARHAAAFAILLGQSPFTGAKSIAPSGSFDRSSSMSQILGNVKSTGFIKS